MKVAHRVIGPDEYDDAARRWPHCCPLVALGDARSGRQLLADAAADAAEAERIGPLRGSPAGRAVLDRVADCVERLADALEPPGERAAADSDAPPTQAGRGGPGPAGPSNTVNGEAGAADAADAGDGGGVAGGPPPAGARHTGSGQAWAAAESDTCWASRPSAGNGGDEDGAGRGTERWAGAGPGLEAAAGADFPQPGLEEGAGGAWGGRDAAVAADSDSELAHGGGKRWRPGVQLG